MLDNRIYIINVQLQNVRPRRGDLRTQFAKRPEHQPSLGRGPKEELAGAPGRARVLWPLRQGTNTKQHPVAHPPSRPKNAARSEASRPLRRKRGMSGVSSFFIWACRQDRIAVNPVQKLERTRKVPALPRSLPRRRVEAILAVIPATKRRDRLLFHIIFETGLRVGEALELHVEDFDLTCDNEHVVGTGKGGRQRTVLRVHRAARRPTTGQGSAALP